jgi:hypothetical protein
MVELKENTVTNPSAIGAKFRTRAWLAGNLVSNCGRSLSGVIARMICAPTLVSATPPRWPPYASAHHHVSEWSRAANSAGASMPRIPCRHLPPLIFYRLLPLRDRERGTVEDEG